MADKLHLHLFGSPQILWQDKALDGFVSNKARALLIFLAVTGRSHSRDALAELLWADTPSTRRANLKRALSNLRGLDGIVLLEEGQHLVALDSHHTWVDVVEFTQLASEATPGDMASLQRAAQLYQGEFLAGFPLSISYEFEAWVLSEQARLKEQLMALLRRLADECARRDKFPQAIATMRRLLQLEPWQEEAHRRLMELLAQNGEASAALAHFEACRRILRAELEVEPDDATLELVAQIRAGAFRSQRQHHFTALSIAPRSSEQADRAAPHNISFATGDYPNRQVLIADPFPAAADHSPSNLPLIPTPIVGREKELTDLAALLANPDCRLITLTGPGGSGKTHLAIEVAQQQVDGYPQGVYFISLAPITDVGHIVPAIAEAVQFHFQNDGRSPQAQLFAYLSRKHMLLVLDNFEHLMEGATLVHELLQSGPGIKCLVTTRERLQLNSETVFVLGSLSTP